MKFIGFHDVIISITVVIVLIVISPLCTGAQNLLPVSNTSQEGDLYGHLHHAGYGISFAAGAPNLGRDAGDVMISLLYAYRYAPTNEIELSLNYMPVQRLREFDGRVLPDSLAYLSLAWVADATFMFQPFEGFWKGWRFGIGPTFALQSMMMQSSGAQSSLQLYTVDSNGVRRPLPVITLPAYPDTYRADGISIGANIKVEYLIRIAQNIDFCLRTQLQAFTPINLVSTNGVGIGPGGSVGSIGGTFRVGW